MKSKNKINSPAEFKIVRLRECPVQSAVLDNPVEIEKFWRQHVETATHFDRERESLWAFFLNTRAKLIGFQQLSQGTKDTVLVNVGDVFRLAAIQNASRIIVAHNHPSGDPSPSDADVRCTHDLVCAGQILKIELLDHVIIGGVGHQPSYASLSERGLFLSKDLPAKNGVSKNSAGINLQLEPELREIAAYWNSAKRFTLSEKFRRWANQLAGSALQLEAVEKLNQSGHRIQN